MQLPTSWMTLTSIVILMALAAAGARAAPPAEFRFTVHDLGSVDDGGSHARAVSSAGKAAGHVTFNIEGQFRPAVFERGGVPAPIFTDMAGQATGINASGEVVGWFGTSSERSFHWKGGVLTTLLGLSTGRTVAKAINDRSEVVGWSQAPSGLPHAFLYRDGVLTDLGAWGGTGGAEATAINQDGDVAGVRYMETDARLMAEGIRIVNGRLENIQALVPGALQVAPQAINRRGDVAGVATDTTIDPDVNRFAFALIGRKAHRIHFPGAIGSVALSINDMGAVVGNSDTGPGTRIRAFLWERGKIVDLTDLPEVRAAGWTWLQEANAISNEGIIVGSGSTTTGAGRAFMLVPTKQ